MPRILINTNHLEKLQGSEIVTLELTEFLLEQGWHVDIFTYLLGGDIQSEFEKLPHQERLLVTNDDNHEFSESYDYIWIQHNVLNTKIRQRLLDQGMTSHFIFNHMSSFVQMEMPLSPEIENELSFAILAVSYECLEVLIKRGIRRDKIVLHDNPAPPIFISPPKSEMISLKNIAIISNHPPKELLQAKDLLNEGGISCTLIGTSGTPVRVSPELIANYDVIITIGKSVQYSLMGGVPVYVYDMYGGEGYLNEENFKASAYHNFSGRATKKIRSAHEIYQEIINGFDEARSYVIEHHSEFVRRWNLESSLSTLFSKSYIKKHVQFDAKIESEFSLHNKLLRQWNTPSWSYQKWSEARTYPQHRLTAIDTILNHSGENLIIDIVIVADVNASEQSLSTTLDSFEQQYYAAKNVWVLSEKDMKLSSSNMIFCDADEFIWSKGITGVAALSRADLLLVIKAGDTIFPHALLKLRERKFLKKDSFAFYFDEDSAGSVNDCKPMLKPDINIDMLRSYPYIGRTLALEPKLISHFGGLDNQLGEFSLIEIVWKIIEHFGPAHIEHIDEVCVRTYQPLLQWLSLKNFRYYQKLINNHFERFGIAAVAEDSGTGATVRVKYNKNYAAKVSIIISTKNNYARLRRCIESIIENTINQSYEIIIADNLSQDPSTIEYLEKLEVLNLSNLTVFRHGEKNNISALNNHAVDVASGVFLLFLSDESEVSSPDWLEELVSIASRPEVGVVGAKVINELAQIEHAGMVLGINGTAGSVFQNSIATANGYMNRLIVNQNVSAVSRACLMINKNLFLSIGGFNDRHFPQHFADVDLALNLSQQGYIHVYTPFAFLYQKSEPKGCLAKSEFQLVPRDKDVSLLQEVWGRELAFDPAYNKQLSKSLPGYEITPYMATIHDPLPGRPLPVVLANNIDRQGCGYYRVIHPFKALEKELFIDGGLDDALFEVPELLRIKPDFLLIQPGLRRGLSGYFERIRRISSAKIVVDYDDYSPNIPVRSIVRQKIKQDIIKDIRRDCEQADWVVVSTAPLADELSRFTTKVKIAKNGLPVEIWSHLFSRRRTKNKLRVGWAGGGSHTGDLSLLKPIVSALEKEVEWVFMGMKPLGVNCEFHQGVPIEIYPEKLASLDLDLALVPLEINQFNICKSNLRLLELGACGVPIICTNIEPFRCNLPVTLVENRFNEWMEAIKSHISEKEALARRGDELRRAIHDDWMLRDSFLEQWREAWTGS